MIFYKENLKESTHIHTHLKVISLAWSQDTRSGYKTMEYVCNEILCSEHSENDLRETVPFTGASERVKYSKINSMEVPDSCAESYKTES